MSAQALCTDDIDVAVEVRLEEFPHSAERLRKVIVTSASPDRVLW